MTPAEETLAEFLQKRVQFRRCLRDLQAKRAAALGRREPLDTIDAEIAAPTCSRSVMLKPICGTTPMPKKAGLL
jgi:hypothetical protein